MMPRAGGCGREDQDSGSLSLLLWPMGLWESVRLAVGVSIGDCQLRNRGMKIGIGQFRKQVFVGSPMQLEPRFQIIQVRVLPVALMPSW